MAANSAVRLLPSSNGCAAARAMKSSNASSALRMIACRSVSVHASGSCRPYRVETPICWPGVRNWPGCTAALRLNAALRLQTNAASTVRPRWLRMNCAASRRSSSSAKSAREAIPSVLPDRRKLSVSDRLVASPSKTVPAE